MMARYHEALGATSPLVLRNAFNGETFIFPNEDDVEIAQFSCTLEPGGSGGGDAMLHVHPGSRETFHVTAGCLQINVDGVDHLVPAGNSLRVEPGETHRFCNASVALTKFDVEFSPPRRHREFFETFASMTEQQPHWFSPNGKPHFLLVCLMLHRFSGHMYLATAPIWAQRLLFGLLAPLAMMIGYRLQASTRRF